MEGKSPLYHSPLPRSFVMRRSRMSDATRAAYDRLYPMYGVSFSPDALDPRTLFPGQEGPVVMEIGFGAGESLIAYAQANPQLSFLGVEVFKSGVARLVREADRLGLANIRVVRYDADAVLREMIAPGTLRGLHVFFPDPWPKKRHHKRRLVGPGFLSVAAARLEPGGIFAFATDNADYAESVLDALAAEAGLEPAGDRGVVDRVPGRPRTRYEAKSTERVFDIVAYRRDTV